MSNRISIKCITALLLLGCLLPMPYGYYQFTRIAVCGLFIWLAYYEYQKKAFIAALICGLSAVLFNPVVKFYIHKKQWQEIDKMFAIALGLWIVLDVSILLKRRKSLE